MDGHWPNQSESSEETETIIGEWPSQSSVNEMGVDGERPSQSTGYYSQTAVAICCNDSDEWNDEMETFFMNELREHPNPLLPNAVAQASNTFDFSELEFEPKEVVDLTDIHVEQFQWLWWWHVLECLPDELASLNTSYWNRLSRHLQNLVSIPSICYAIIDDELNGDKAKKTEIRLRIEKSTQVRDVQQGVTAAYAMKYAQYLWTTLRWVPSRFSVCLELKSRRNQTYEGLVFTVNASEAFPCTYHIRSNLRPFPSHPELMDVIHKNVHLLHSSKYLKWFLPLYDRKDCIYPLVDTNLFVNFRLYAKLCCIRNESGCIVFIHVFAEI
jgi:hypothetical protein